MKCYKRNQYIFIQENAFENVVCEMSTILSWPQCVKASVWIANYIPHKPVDVFTKPC